MLLDDTTILRFWAYVAKSDDCWNWTASLDHYGYGQINVQGQIRKSHRLSYELNVGPIPDGRFVLHKCDNPQCVRPDHLFLGTQVDNMRDCQAKGRWRGGILPGEAHPSHKLTESQVRVIYRRYHFKHESTRALAAEFSVSRRAIRDIVTCTTWQHLRLDQLSSVQ